MAEGKDPQLSGLEQSLINFLQTKREIEEKIPGGARRLKSLTLNMKKDNTKVVFTVQIGMMEAAFNPNNGLKERGSCYGLERYIRDWFERPTVSHELKLLVKEKFRDN